MMNYFKNIKIAVTPLNIILFIAFFMGFIYTSVYLVKIMVGPKVPVIPEMYIEEQVKAAFEAAKFNAKAIDPRIEKNLFHPERRITKRVSLAAEANPQFTLYGTFISPSLQMAYLEDTVNPQASPSGARRQQALKKGEIISGFVLKEIYPHGVLLVRDNERVFVQMSDKKKQTENVPAPQDHPVPQEIKENNPPPN